VALTGSTYIKFENPSIGSLRVGDHPGRKKYAYRWNLFLNLPEDQRGMRIDRGLKRWYYDASQLDEFVFHITNYANKIERIKSETND